MAAPLVAVATAGLVALAQRRERRRHQAVEAENARLLSEARERESERSLLADQLITAEQDERRRLAVFLHDGPVQWLSGIALMLDAAQHALEDERTDEARTVVARALERHRDTIRSLRDLSFALEPVVLRDQRFGFGAAVHALAQQIGLQHQVQIDIDVAAAEDLTETAQAALYQIVREALHSAVRRGPPTRMSVKVARDASGVVEAAMTDDAPGERRRTAFEPIADRARTLNGRLDVEHDPDGGTKVRVQLPAYLART